MIRGLKPYPAYKDSGISSIGKVPEHWQVRRQRNVLQMLVSTVDKHIIDGEMPVRLCNYVDVYKNERITHSLQFMRATATSDEISQFRLQRGDVLITKDSEAWNDIGVPALVEYAAPDLVCGYHLAILRPHLDVVASHYLLRTLQSQAVAVQYHVTANGVTRYGLSHNAIKSIFLPIPPLAEQEAIARFLEHAYLLIRRYIQSQHKLIGMESHPTALDRAIGVAQRNIGILREYRARLVEDVVTGKLDVREAAARLPEESAEPEPPEEAKTAPEAGDVELDSATEEAEV